MTGGWWKSSRGVSREKSQNGCRTFENQSAECRAVCRVCVFWLVHWSLLKWVGVKVKLSLCRKATCIFKCLSEYVVLQWNIRRQVVDGPISEVTIVSIEDKKLSAHCSSLMLKFTEANNISNKCMGKKHNERMPAALHSIHTYFSQVDLLIVNKAFLDRYVCVCDWLHKT